MSLQDLGAKPADGLVKDTTTQGFMKDVIEESRRQPVLVDFWAEWCGPCKALGPVLEKLAGEFAGGFKLAKVDVDKEQQLAGYFQIKSIPTVMLLKDGQIVDGFPGALPEGQLREFLQHHGIQPSAGEDESQAAPDKDELKLDLALALLTTGATAEARQILDGLPANLATDDRAIRAHARLGFHALLADAPPRETLENAVAADPTDLRARHLLGVRMLMDGDEAAGLDQFLEMLRRDRAYGDQLAKRSLIDAFRIIEDPDLVGSYRRRMASLLF